MGELEGIYGVLNMKWYNDYELRFLQVLMDRDDLEFIKRTTRVQPVKSKKVYLVDEGLVFE